MSPKDAALHWLDWGVSTCPLYYRSKLPHSNALIRAGFTQDGKATWQPLKSKLPTEKQIELWFEDGRFANLAVICGWQNLIALDFDSPESYSAWLVWMLEHDPKVLNTYRTLSSRGLHVYFFLDEPIKVNTIQGALFEVKANGKMITVPPSVHETGKVYTALDDINNIQTISLDRILNYSPLHFAPVVYPLSRSRYAPTVNSGNDLLPEILKIPILQFFDNAMPVDADKRFYRTHCPFHGHRSNFWIDTQLNICGCYKGCIGKPSYDVIDFFQQLQNIDKKSAIQELKRLL